MTVFFDILTNLCVIISFSLLSAFLNYNLKNNVVKKILQGLLFGSSAVFGMLNPVILDKALIFDQLTVSISLAGIYYGPAAAFISGSMAAVLRFYQGGTGVMTGILIIISSAVIGIFFYQVIKKNNKEIPLPMLYLFGILVHVSMLLLMFTLPESMAIPAIKNISLPVILVYPVLTVILGLIINLSIVHFETILNLKMRGETISSISNNLEHGMIYQVLVKKDGTRRFTYLSDSVIKLYGITPEQGMNDPDHIYNRVHPDDVERLVSEESQCIEELKIFRSEIRIRETSGDYRWSLLISKPSLLKNGDLLWDGIETIITERKKIEEELKLSEAKFSKTFNSSPVGLGLSTLAEGRYIDVNEAFTKMLGYTREEVLGRTSQELAIFAEPSDRNRILEKMKTDGHVSGIEIKIRSKTGEILSVLFSVENINIYGTECLLVAVHDITERKRAERMLESTESRLRSTLENTPNVAIQWYDLDGRVVYWNHASETMYGWKSEEALGKTLDQLIHTPDEFQEFKRILSGIHRTGKPFGPYQATVRLAGGNQGYVLATTFGFELEPGKPGFVCMDIDITELKRVEEELKTSEASYRLLFQHNPAPMLIYERGTLQLLAVNDAFERHYGYTLDEIRQMRLTDLYPDDEKGPIAALASELIRQGHAYAGEWHHLKRDGSIISIEARSHNIDYEGRPGRIAVISDITERKLAEKALRESEAVFRSIIENSPVGYHIYNLQNDGRLVFSMYNNAADIILHASHKQFIGLDILQAFPALAGTGIPEMYKSVAMGELGMQNFEASYDYDGIKGIYEVRVFSGSPGQTVVNFTDISERKQVEERQARLTEQLHQSRKMDAIGQLAGGVAHDFNNLLAGIMGSAQLLQIQESLSEKHQKYISMILSAAERAGNLTKKLLTFSRSGTKASTAVDCVKIVNDTVEFLQHTIDRNIIITVENRAVQTLIAGDETMLMNALMNIAINASHAMPGGGKLTFTVENFDLDKKYCEASPFSIKPGKYIGIAVRDTGCGMSHEVVSRIFEPFFTTKEHEKGTGLGLSIVYGTVLEHEGAITVSSEPGTGTVFHIYLPASEDSVSRKTTSENLPCGTGTVLLIDDEELIRITAKGLLESLGYKVIVETNGEDGVRTFIERKDEIDLIILDMIMPVMGGREAFIKLREIDQNIPVLIASGFAKEEHMVLLKEQGISGFLQKPFRVSELAEKVHDVLKE